MVLLLNGGKVTGILNVYFGAFVDAVIGRFGAALGRKLSFAIFMLGFAWFLVFVVSIDGLFVMGVFLG